MNKVIDGKKFSTDTAKRIAVWNNGEALNSDLFESDALYKTKSGNYFLHRFGGRKTDGAVLKNGKMCSCEWIQPIDEETAAFWAEDIMSGDEYERLFNLDDEKTKMSLDVSADIKEKVDALKEKSGLTTGQLLEQLIIGKERNDMNEEKYLILDTEMEIEVIETLQLAEREAKKRWVALPQSDRVGREIRVVRVLKKQLAEDAVDESGKVDWTKYTDSKSDDYFTSDLFEAKKALSDLIEDCCNTVSKWVRERGFKPLANPVDEWLTYCPEEKNDAYEYCVEKLGEEYVNGELQEFASCANR